ncbi:hypothetical protein HY990_03730 [Candidatus Micrarchaeota archaeon]|nr:hypothetical protein [Candidatus Micrarchaeota archaeon]
MNLLHLAQIRENDSLRRDVARRAEDSGKRLGQRMGGIKLPKWAAKPESYLLGEIERVKFELLLVAKAEGIRITPEIDRKIETIARENFTRGEIPRAQITEIFGRKPPREVWEAQSNNDLGYFRPEHRLIFIFSPQQVDMTHEHELVHVLHHSRYPGQFSPWRGQRTVRMTYLDGAADYFSTDRDTMRTFEIETARLGEKLVELGIHANDLVIAEKLRELRDEGRLRIERVNRQECLIFSYGDTARGYDIKAEDQVRYIAGRRFFELLTRETGEDELFERVASVPPRTMEHIHKPHTYLEYAKTVGPLERALIWASGQLPI